MKSIFTLCICVFLASGVAFAQKSKLTLADKHFQAFDFETAIAIYDDVLEKHPENKEALRKISLSLTNVKQNELAEERLKQLTSLEESSVADLVMMADVLKKNGKLNEAAEVYEKIHRLYPENETGKRYYAHPQWVKSLLRDSSRYVVKNTGINSGQSDFAPAFMNENIIFSSSRGEGKGKYHSYSWNDQSYLNLFTADIREDSVLANADVLRNSVNTRFHEGTVTHDPHDNLLYITRNNYHNGKKKKDKQGNLNLGIFIARFEDGEYGTVEPFEHNDKSYSVGHPALSKDGKKMYFISDMPGGQGGTDIYFSEKKDGKWSEPKNIGPEVNTSGNEMFPFLLDDNLLYFASDGHVGLGGLDLYHYRADSENAQVINMGFPINTAQDDFGICVFPNGKSGFLSSNRPGGMGDDDIYKYTIADPEKVVISGVVLDQKTNDPVEGAKVMIKRSNTTDSSDIVMNTDKDGRYELTLDSADQATVVSTKEGYFKKASSAEADNNAEYVEGVDIKLDDYQFGVEGYVIYAGENKPAKGASLKLYNESGELIAEEKSSAEGQYNFELEGGSKYRIVCEKEGYLTQQIDFATPQDPSPALRSDFQLFSPENESAIQLGNIYYEYDKHNIRKEAEVELNKLVSLMQENPGMKIEVQSHTDSRGSDAYNIELSKKRAASVMAYLVRNGVDKSRLDSRGFGESKPINKCENESCAEWQHQENRRTEFLIVEY